MKKHRYLRSSVGSEEEKGGGWFKIFLQVFVAVVLVFFSIFFIWYSVFLSSHNYYRVDGASMVPTLNDDIPAKKFDEAQGISYDCVYVNKEDEPKLFDIIVINTHQHITDKDGNKVKKTIIKRLLAEEGDYVTIAKTVDDAGNERMTLFRIPSGTDRMNYRDEDGMMTEHGENGYQIYDPDSIWAHKKSYDQPLTYSFQVESADKEFEYDYNFYWTFLQFYDEGAETSDYFVSDEGLLYVKVPDGKFFYLGDNRGHSSDAREDGFRDVEDIVGPVEIVIRNNNFFKRIGTFLSYFFEEVEKFFAR